MFTAAVRKGLTDAGRGADQTEEFGSGAEDAVAAAEDGLAVAQDVIRARAERGEKVFH